MCIFRQNPSIKQQFVSHYLVIAHFCLRKNQTIIDLFFTLHWSGNAYITVI